MEIKNEIWILADDRPGTVSQAIGLAQAMGVEYKTIQLKYSFWARLPNFFLSESLLRISAENSEQFKNANYLPSHVISAGRRSAPIAVYLKEKSQNRSKIIQIMNPNMDFKKFDFVVLPKHDEVKEAGVPNLITTIGALTKVTDKIIASEREKFSEIFNDIKGVKIALLVGGSSNKTKFTADSAITLAQTASAITNKMNATLLILNSRRTGDELTHEIKSNLKCSFKFFDWLEMKDKNPYLAILGDADFFIITGDSVSMISECCSTGKPVYIFDEKEISSKKHRKFHRDLFAGNYARELLGGEKELENFVPQKLWETKRVALLVKE